MQSIHLVNRISVCLYSLATRRHQSAPVPSSSTKTDCCCTKQVHTVYFCRCCTRQTSKVVCTPLSLSCFFCFSFSSSSLFLLLGFSFFPWFLFLFKFPSFLLSFYALLLVLLLLKTRKLGFSESSLVLHTDTSQCAAQTPFANQSAVSTSKSRLFRVQPTPR